MTWSLPSPLVGILAGFGLGFMASFNLILLGIDGSGWVAVGLGLLGAIGGGVMGYFLQGPVGRARTVAWWCATMAVSLGGVAFLMGFAGLILLHPELPQGPLLGIFCTGPLGALAGAIGGTVIGLLVPSPSAQRLQREPLHSAS
jgi:hypothetical protein